MMPSWTSLLAQLEMASPALCAVSVPTTGMLVAEQLVTRPEGLPTCPLGILEPDVQNLLFDVHEPLLRPRKTSEGLLLSSVMARGWAFSYGS